LQNDIQESTMARRVKRTRSSDDLSSMPISELLPLPNIAIHLRVSVATLTRAARSRQLVAVKKGKFWYTTLSEGERWKAEAYRKHVGIKSVNVQRNPNE
jgi:hypothetical protein